MSTLPVVEQILHEADHPMSVREIVELAGETLPTKSKTPDTVVARDLSMDIKRKADESLFVRTSPGRYATRANAEKWKSEQAARDAATTQPQDGATPVLSGQMSGDRAAPLPARPAGRRAETEDSVPASS